MVYTHSVALSETVGHTLRAHWQTRNGMCGEIQNLVIRETTEECGKVSPENKGLGEAVMAAFTYLKD